jgi:hypothetical protein
MKHCLYLFFILSIFFQPSFAAEKVTCEPYYSGNKNNALFNLSVFGGNTINPGDKSTRELFPDNEVRVNKDNWIQYFYLKQYYRQYKKLSLGCAYNDGQLTAKKIPKFMHICVKKYTTAKLKPNQSYITKFSCY